MSNAALGALQQIITILLAFMGVFVAIRPPKKSSSQEYAVIAAFVVFGLIGVSATYVQGSRLDIASEKQQQQLNAIQKNTEQPPKVVMENKIDPTEISKAIEKGMRPAQSKVDAGKRAREERTNAEQSLRTTAFTLSTDVLTFLSEREKSRPKLSFLSGDLGLRKDETIEQSNARVDKEFQDYQNYELESRRIFKDRYWPRSLQVLTQLKLSGFNVEPVWYEPTSTEQVRDFAIGLANVAEKALSR